MKKALIIGGSGGLSSVVARLAMINGYEVSAVTRGNRPLQQGVISIRADRNDEAAFETAILSKGEKWDVVFDCICMNQETAAQDLSVLPKVTNRLVVVSTVRRQWKIEFTMNISLRHLEPHFLWKKYRSRDIWKSIRNTRDICVTESMI